jgi:uncharacterized membrane protein YbhN (UPF0104 family)
MIEGRPPAARRRILRRVVSAAVSLGLVVAIFVFAIPALVDYGEVWATMTALSPARLLLLLGVAALSIGSYWLVLTAALPGLTLPGAAVVHQASTAVANSVPGGGAVAVGLTYAMYRSWGFGNGEIVRAVLVSGVWDAALKLALPAAALILLLASGGADPARTAAAAAGLAVVAVVAVGFALVLRSDRLARFVGEKVEGAARRLPLRRFRRADLGWVERFGQLRAASLLVVRSRWLRLTLAAIVSHLALFALLLVAVRAAGTGPEALASVTVFAGFAFVRLLQVLPITPGGVGLVELGYVAVLTAGLPDEAAAGVVAGILLFRFLSYAIPIFLGAAAWLWWRTTGEPGGSPTRRDAPG